MRHTTFRLTADPTVAQQRAFARHAGARRWAHNQSLALVKAALEARREGQDVEVPWTAFDLINAINAFKRSPAAGLDDHGRPGLPWRGDVCAQVFEEGAVDCARGLGAWSESRRGERPGRRVGFPRFKRRGRCREGFRLRNKTDKRSGGQSVRVGEGDLARSLTLPVIGQVRIHDDTRPLRRLLARGAKITFVTLARHGDRWVICCNLEAPDLHPARHHGDLEGQTWVGVDRGIKALLVAADRRGRELARIPGHRPLAGDLRRVRRDGKTVSRRQRGSGRRRQATAALSRRHARVSDRRRTVLHQVSTGLAKTHGRLCLEDLHVHGLARNHRLARHIADVAMAELARQLTYKLTWRSGQLALAPRFFPSSKTCSGCGWIDRELTLSQRTFCCQRCGLTIDRDLNAAVNLAAWAETNAQSVAAKQAETQNARGEDRAGRTPGAVKRASIKREPDRRPLAA